MYLIRTGDGRYLSGDLFAGTFTLVDNPERAWVYKTDEDAATQAELIDEQAGPDFLGCWTITRYR